jgi:hypothetical protein
MDIYAAEERLLEQLFSSPPLTYQRNLSASLLWKPVLFWPDVPALGPFHPRLKHGTFGFGHSFVLQALKLFG